MSPDDIYETQEQLNKQLEARNRDLTPSVPIEQLGGRLPSQDRIAFVDMKSITGHDGSSFFMPGYIPGKNATYRVGGQKGVAQTVDYKQLVQDLFGQNEFYLPALNAPQDIKDLFATKGIDAVREKLSESEFADYFLDIMKYDALISDSVIKTPAYKGLNNAGAQRFFYNSIGGPEGFGIVKTAAEFLTKQRSLGSQMSQYADLSVEELEENQKAWENYIHELRYDPVKTAQRLFGDPNSALDKKITDNPGLIWEDPIARRRVLNEISSARESMSRQELFGQDNLMMGLVAANPGELFLKLGAMNGYRTQNDALAKVLSLSDGSVGAKFLSDLGDQRIVAARWPGVPGEQFAMDVDQRYSSLGDRYGLADNVVYINTSAIHKMGGGDVDGDTVEILRNKLRDYYEHTIQKRGTVYGTRNEDLKQPPIAIHRGVQSSDMADLLYREAALPMLLGAVSNAQDALQQIDWTDREMVKQYGKAGSDLAVLYDIDSTFMKTGVLSDWTRAALNTKYLGKPFSHVYKHLMGAVQTGDYSQMGDFSKINFPSRYHGLTVSMLDSLSKNPMSNSAIEQLIAAQTDLQG